MRRQLMELKKEEVLELKNFLVDLMIDNLNDDQIHFAQICGEDIIACQKFLNDVASAEDEEKIEVLLAQFE